MDQACACQDAGERGKVSGSRLVDLHREHVESGRNHGVVRNAQPMEKHAAVEEERRTQNTKPFRSMVQKLERRRSKTRKEKRCNKIMLLCFKIKL